MGRAGFARRGFPKPDLRVSIMTTIAKPRQDGKRSRIQYRTRQISLASGTAALALMAATAAQAEITNTATASGTYNSTTYTSNTAQVDVTVQPAGPALTATKSGGTVNPNVTGDGDLQAGDTITYTIAVDNTGNVTMTNIVPSDDGITFGGQPGTGTFSYSPANYATLAPSDAPVSFTATYTLTALDIARGAAAGTDGVSNTAHATGTYNGTDTDSPVSNPVLVTLGADPELSIVKTFVLTKASGNTGTDAEIGDTIVYTYEIANTGNVPISAVSVNDDHEGAVVATNLFVENPASLVDGPLANSADASTGAGTPVDGVWDLLGPGATVSMTYTHTVTQTEFDNQ
jgi:hypothetical protein